MLRVGIPLEDAKLITAFRVTAASFALGGIEEHVAGAEASVAGKTSKVRTIIGSAQNFFPGYTLQERDSFQAAANRQFIMNFMCGAIVLAMDLSLLFVLAVAASTHDPHVAPTKRGKASEYAGRALFVSALCTLPVSAFLAAIAAYVMKLSVSSGAFICDPFFQRRPSILDETFFPHRRSAIDPMVDPILDYITSPSLFQTCSNSFGGFLVGDIDVLANSDVAGIMKLFVKNITKIDFKHSDASLRAYYTKTVNFDRKLSTTQASISVSSIKTIQDMISLGSAHISEQITVQVAKALRLIAERHTNSVSVAVRGIKDKNGLWVVLMVIASLFNVACYASVRLSKYFLTMDKVEFEDPGAKLESEQAGDVERGTGTSDSALAANRPCANAAQEQVAAAEGNEGPSHEAPNCVKDEPRETPGPISSVTSGRVVEDGCGGGEQEMFNKIRRTSPKTRREAVTKAAFEAFRSMSVKLLGSRTVPGPVASQNLESEPQAQPEPSQPEGVVDSADRSSRRLPPCPTGKGAELDAVEAVVVSPKRNTVWFSEEVLEAYS
ncbi:uncharacterized protein LOC144173994 isoform X2 [Haemaphysalis longicornis]